MCKKERKEGMTRNRKKRWEIVSVSISEFIILLHSIGYYYHNQNTHPVLDSSYAYEKNHIKNIILNA